MNYPVYAMLKDVRSYPEEIPLPAPGYIHIFRLPNGLFAVKDSDNCTTNMATGEIVESYRYMEQAQEAISNTKKLLTCLGCEGNGRVIVDLGLNVQSPDWEACSECKGTGRV